MTTSGKLLINFKPTKDFFIGIDSDGCVFDTMEIKHKECFCPNFVKYWGMQSISKYARETWEFVNLYSVHRGCNRFLALIETLKLLNDRIEVKKRNFELPQISILDEWTKTETRLGNPALERYAREINDTVLNKALSWSKAVNEDIESMVFGIPPFLYVRESLIKLKEKSDVAVVSQTPVEALEREWKENKIDTFINIIAGQEQGTKSDHLKFAAKGKYKDTKILMIGDAMGDLKAASENDVLFYPVIPGREEQSWERFLNEGLDRFFNETFFGEYQESLIKEFKVFLPEIPPWK
jgi:phosphoglycolate phosphatase-like HAD superfamily hydrolase